MLEKSTLMNEHLTLSQRNETNYQVLLLAVSQKKDAAWWIENGRGDFAYLFQADMPRLSLPKSGNPDWYKEL